MFLLVSVHHVGAHPGEHQHGVSIQISISLGKAFLRISRIRNIPLTWILARVFVYVPPFISQILDFIYWTVLIFILINFEWPGMAWHWKPAIRWFNSRSSERATPNSRKLRAKWLLFPFLFTCIGSVKSLRYHTNRKNKSKQNKPINQ